MYPTVLLKHLFRAWLALRKSAEISSNLSTIEYVPISAISEVDGWNELHVLFSFEWFWYFLHCHPLRLSLDLDCGCRLQDEGHIADISHVPSNFHHDLFVFFVGCFGYPRWKWSARRYPWQLGSTSNCGRLPDIRNGMVLRRRMGWTRRSLSFVANSTCHAIDFSWNGVYRCFVLLYFILINQFTSRPPAVR